MEEVAALSLMELVIDTNVVIAGFLRAATTRELLLDERLVRGTESPRFQPAMPSRSLRMVQGLRER